MSRLVRSVLLMAWLGMIAAGLARLRFDTQMLNLLPPDLPTVRGLKLYEEHFSNANELIISVEGKDPATVEAGARELALELRSETNRVAQVAWTAPWREHPEQNAELIAYLWLNQPPESLRAFERRLSSSNLTTLIEEAKSRLAASLSAEELARRSYDPFGFLELPESAAAMPAIEGEGPFASENGTLRVMFVQAAVPTSTYRESQRWLEQLRPIIARWRREQPGFEKLELGFTGRPAFVSEISSGMEREMIGSVAGTVVIIGILFWWAHRQFKPLLWLVSMLALVLGTTLSAGGLIFGELNVISAGFAAILLGLSADYGLVLYQEFRASSESKQRVRRAVAPSIFSAAATTAGAFLALNVGGLPGLAQLGTLVGVGILIAALVMLSMFLAPFQKQPGSVQIPKSRESSTTLGWWLTGLVVIGGGFVLLFSPPRIDVSSAALRPTDSAAFRAMERIRSRMNQPREPLWLISEGNTFEDVARKFEAVESILREAQSRGQIERFALPGHLIPRPARQEENRTIVFRLAFRRGEFNRAATEHGFKPEALRLTNGILDAWTEAANSALFVPRLEAGRWIVERVVSRKGGAPLAIGLVYPKLESDIGRIDPELRRNLASAGLILAGWELLGGEVFEVIRARAPTLAALIGALVLICLGLAFRRAAPVLLSLAALACGGLLLVAVMRLLGWSWNLMNLMAVPLLAGAGLDYGIHLQLALRRHGGEIREVHASTGRALFLCAATTVAGFGSLAWAGNPGLSSLGMVCAAGIICVWFVAVRLLPAWWKAAHSR